MSSLSDLGRLWFRRGVAGFNPIENFSTEALAIAIGHDDIPMVRALKQVQWPAGAPLDFSRVRHIKAEVQYHLPPADGIRSGYLDLVLDLTLDADEHRVAWVEVKVDSPEGRGYEDPSDHQLTVYQAHANRESEPSRRPIIFTLSKTALRQLDPAVNNFPIGWLSWKDLASVIERSPRADKRWIDLRRFLAEYGTAPWPIPAGLPTIVAKDYLPVLFKVNAELRRRWPEAGMAWKGDRPADLETYALTSFEATGEFTTTGGLLTYGLVPSGPTWAWSVRVGTLNYRRVPLEASTLIRRADDAGLSEDWSRGSSLRSVLEIHAPLVGELSDCERAVEWFVCVLDEIQDKDLLRDFLDGLTVTPWSRLKQRAEELDLAEDLENLVKAARDGGLHVSARYVVSTDGRWALVAPDAKGLQTSGLMYFVPEPDPLNDAPRIRVVRAEGTVEKLLGLDIQQQQQLYGEATQCVRRGESHSFSDRVLGRFTAMVRERHPALQVGRGIIQPEAVRPDA